MTEVVSGVVSFFFGLVGGVILQQLRFRNQRKMERVKRLMPYMETVHPVLEELRDESQHAIKLQDRNDLMERSRYVQRLQQILVNYGLWYSELIQEGLKPELQSLDYELFASFHGLFVYHQMSKEHGGDFLSQHLTDLSEVGNRALGRLTQFLEN